MSVWLSSRVAVYRNLHRGLFSVKRRDKPVEHARRIVLRDVRLLVRPAGRAKVLRDRRKAVHAFVTGVPVGGNDAIPRRGWRSFSYDPYANEHFVLADTGEPVLAARFAELAMTPEGKSRCRLIP